MPTSVATGAVFAPANAKATSVGPKGAVGVSAIT